MFEEWYEENKHKIDSMPISEACYAAWCKAQTEMFDEISEKFKDIKEIDMVDNSDPELVCALLEETLHTVKSGLFKINNPTTELTRILSDQFKYLKDFECICTRRETSIIDDSAGITVNISYMRGTTVVVRIYDISVIGGVYSVVKHGMENVSV